MFTDWLGGWLGALADRLPAYQAPHNMPDPAPDRMLFRSPGTGRDLAIWICSATGNPHHGLQATIGRMRAAQELRPELKDCEFVIASPDDLGDLELVGISLWDAEDWLDMWEKHQRWSEGIAARLKRLLWNLPSGNTDGVDRQYEKLVCDIFRFLFYPALFNPLLRSSSATGSQFRDIMFAIDHNPANIWEQLGSRHSANNLVIEAKNYRAHLGPSPGRQLRSYLKPHAPGALGVLVSRKGPNAGAWRELKENAAHSLAMLPMDDTTLVEMIDAELDRRWGGQHGGSAAIVATLYSQLMSG